MRKDSVLYDNLEFNNTQLRENERREDRVPPRTTVMDEYEDHYRWNTENLGRASIAKLVSTIKRGLKL